MKNARNTSKEFRAIAHIRAKIEAQVEARYATVSQEFRKPIWMVLPSIKANYIGAALLAAGVTAGNVLAVLRSIWRDAHCRPPRITAYMTARQAARSKKRQEWAAKRDERKYNRAVRLWEKYGRACPYEEA